MVHGRLPLTGTKSKNAGAIKMLIVEIFLGLLALIAAVIFYINFKTDIRIESSPQLYHDEQIADTLHTSSPYDKQNTYLTNRRLYQIQKKWFLSRTLFTFMDLNEVRAIHYVELLNIFAMAIGLAVSFVILPLGYVIILFSFSHFIVRLTFYSANKKIRIHSSLADKDSFRSFLHRVQLYSYKEKTGVDSQPPIMPARPETAYADFRFGMPVVFVILIYIILGALQKLIQGSIKFDDFHFFPVYIAIPLIAGYCFGGPVGFRSGLFGGLGLLTLIFPIPLYAIGKTIFAFEYISVLLYLALAGWIAGMIRKNWTGVILIACWLIIVGLFKSEDFGNIHLYLKLTIGTLIYLIACVVYDKQKPAA